MGKENNISRRSFVQKTAMVTAAAGLLSNMTKCETVPSSRAEGKRLSAYYFRAHMYTLVPTQVREDLKYMADIGTDSVCVAVLEQDLRAAVENVQIIAEEAEKLGIELFVVPSRWGGLLAGAPKVPSVFTVQNPDGWLRKKDGSFYKDKNVGVHSSIHYPETINFFKSALDKLFDLWNVKGIIWDEPKIYDKKDYSELARKNIKDIEDVNNHNDAFSNFFSVLNSHIKTKYPQVETNLFAYANMPPNVIDSLKNITDLDYLGCDGRPWSASDAGDVEQVGKVLLGPGQNFQKAAKESGKKSLFLIENHNMSAENNALMDKRLPEVMDLNPDHLIYYYYPRNLDKPEENMAIIKKHLKNFK
ncbi:MAG: twin-arginine translocation signal domain-containing protein [Bacteroidota bacterium]